MEYLLHLDETLFTFINKGCQNVFFDWLLPYWRNKNTWIPLYLFFTVFLFVKLRKKGLPVLIFLLLSVGVSDLTSSFLIKESVQRVRPCNDLVFRKHVKLLAPCGSGYSFTSSHAANHAAIAIFLIFSLGQIIGKGRYLLLFWAISIGFAQIYVGVHYPLDVFFGFLVGGFIGYLGAFVLFSRGKKG